MCGWDCEPTLYHLRTVHIPFAMNQNLSVFCANTKGIECAKRHRVFRIHIRFVENYFTTRPARIVRKRFGSHVCTSLQITLTNFLDDSCPFSQIHPHRKTFAQNFFPSRKLLPKRICPNAIIQYVSFIMQAVISAHPEPSLKHYTV